MTIDEVWELCKSIGINQYGQFQKEIRPYTVHTYAMEYMPALGVRIAAFNENDDFDFGNWLDLDLNERIIRDRINDLGQSIKKFRNYLELEKLQRDFK